MNSKDIKFDDFIKNHSLLKEDHRLDELIEFYYADIKKRLESYQKSSVVAIVGPYGTGKSTALNQVRQQKNDVQWLQFDAWRYPERKGLWDGLVIEVAKQLGQDKKALRKLDGHKSVIGRWGSPVAEFFTQVSDFIPKDAFTWVGAATKGSGAASKVGEKVSGIFEKSPAKRTYEIERILSDLLLAIEKDTIYLVVEDIDRSGADGINFLETLSFFISNSEELKEKKIIAIALISNNSYEDNLESYLKCIDYFEFFEPRIGSVNHFMEQVFADGAFPEDDKHKHFKSLTKDFLEGLFKEFPTDMTPRKLKLMLRQASNAYRLQKIDGHSPDWRVTLCMQAAKYLPDESDAMAPRGTAMMSCFEEFKNSETISGSSLFGSYLYALADKSIIETSLYKDTYDESRERRIKQLKEGRYSFNMIESDNDLPWINRDPFEDSGPRAYIARYYLEY
ncbi:MAG: P-loop NTPase fold protein [Candidatus Saccharimonadales bacterium]